MTTDEADVLKTRAITQIDALLNVLRELAEYEGPGSLADVADDLVNDVMDLRDDLAAARA